jgi:glutamate/tyrosine decarboxylase-like PLP-dependent enzyme
MSPAPPHVPSDSAPESPLLEGTARLAVEYLAQLPTRPVPPPSEAVAALAGLCTPLPLEPTEPGDVMEMLAKLAGPATVASAGGRYFGFVTGGCLPAALAAAWLASAWDQNGGLRVQSPAGAALEETGLEWTRELLRLPPGVGGGVVTGATMANFTCLAAARHALLARAGWNVEDDGLFDAPPLTVVIGDEAHTSLLKALGMLGLGRKRVMRVAVDGQGRILADRLPQLDPRTILCLQAGNVNTGAFDPAEEICPRARDAGAWVHVDGAFGLWAAASPQFAHLTDGFAEADSWATDAHKWPNIGYDCGIALVRDPAMLREAMSAQAAYLVQGDKREPCHFTPELSRRARGVELWAGLRSLGRSGMAALVERTSAYARQFAEGLTDAGYRVLNEVVINQVLVSFGSADRTLRTIERVQAGGTCWCGSTVWQGHTAMRISVSSWATTPEDVERSLAAILEAARLAPED